MSFISKIIVYIYIYGLILENANSIHFKGKFANIGELPYVVHIIIGKTHSCTGALIDKSWILSAAHCFNTDKTSGKPKSVNPESVTITAGINDYANTTVPSKQKRNGHQIIMHPDYQPNKLSKLDFALVKVESPFELNANVSTVEIEGTGWPWTDGKKGRNCIAGGFGRVSMTSAGNNTRLKYLEVQAMHGDRACPCTQRWQWKRVVCLKPEEGSGLCPGDSGSVVTCDNKAIGVAHVILDRRSCSFIHMPDPNIECLKLTTITFLMFTCPENDWIRRYVPSVPPTPQSCRSCTIEVHSITILTAIFIILRLN